MSECGNIKKHIFDLWNKFYTSAQLGYEVNIDQNIRNLFNCKNINIVRKELVGVSNKESNEMNLLLWTLETSYVDYSYEVKQIEKNIIYKTGRYTIDDLIQVRNRQANLLSFNNYLDLFFRNNYKKWIRFLECNIGNSNHYEPKIISATIDVDSLKFEVTRILDKLDLCIINKPCFIKTSGQSSCTYTDQHTYIKLNEYNDTRKVIRDLYHEYGHFLFYQAQEPLSWLIYCSNFMCDELPSCFFERLCDIDEWSKLTKNNLNGQLTLIRQNNESERKQWLTKYCEHVLNELSMYNSFYYDVNKFVDTSYIRRPFYNLNYCIGLRISEFLVSNTYIVLGSLINKKVGSVLKRTILKHGCHLSLKEKIYKYCDEIGIQTIDEDIADLIDSMD